MSFTYIGQTDVLDDAHKGSSLVTYECGLPVRAFRARVATVETRSGQAMINRLTEYQWATPLPRFLDRLMLNTPVRPIAFAPIWGPFAASTAMYGCVWAAIPMIVRYLLRARRRAAGRCARCGYAVASIVPRIEYCPECGATIGESAAITSK
ncbi:MAG: hypothetical protein ACKVW3_08365 [Phycisphaerales bacterium]